MIWRSYGKSIKTRLIVNVILIHAVLMGLIVFDMLNREHRFMENQLSAKGFDLTSILASNASQYLLNNDIVALNELIAEMENISDHYMVFIMDTEGKVRASLPGSYFNRTLTDDISRTLFQKITATERDGVQLNHGSLVDTLYKIKAEDKTIGYARAILDSNSMNNALHIITKEGIFFIIIAIFAGALFAWISVWKMTERLNKLTAAAHELAKRNFDTLLPRAKGEDEINTMIEAFSVMQHSLHDYIRKIDANEKRLNLALEGSSDGLWDWNLVTNEIYFSPRWKEMLGYGDDELPNTFESWRKNIHPHDLEKTETFLETFLHSNRTRYEQKFRMRTKEGTYLPILARGKKVDDKNGRAVRMIGTFVDISEITQAQKRLQYQAQHDALTHLPNRLLFMEHLQTAIEQAHRHGTKTAVLFLDLDYFKEINDSMGHGMGDRLLIAIADILQKDTVRENDTIARLGGDEFAIIVNDITSTDVAIGVVHKIMDRINIPLQLEEHEFYNSFSIGIALYPDDGDNAAVLLKNADAAMNKAKKNGRNTYQFYTQDMTEKALERLLLETSLRHAIKNDELEVYYQPQVNILSKAIIGMEALVRWHHKEMGMIPPSLLIPLAEETGLITAVDLCVMRSVVKQCRAWKREGLSVPRIAINLSVIELTHGSYIEAFTQALRDQECSPSMFELEITESQLMKDPQLSIQKLNQLKALGVTLSIDDFGTGYSSLSYLKQLPIHKLKIDKSFVDDIVNDKDDREIIKTIIAMAKNMKLRVIAEGVENGSQLEFLAQQGCHEVQGYYYYKPMSADELRPLLQKEVPALLSAEKADLDVIY